MTLDPKTLQLPVNFDAASVVELRPELDRIAATVRTDVVLDMSRTRFLDSSGIGAMVFLHKRLVANGLTLRLQSPEGQPRQLIEFLRLPKVIPVLN